MDTPKKERGRPRVATPKTSTSFRLSPKARKLLDVLTVDSGLSQASVIEVALRDMAKVRNVTIEEESEVA